MIVSLYDCLDCNLYCIRDFLRLIRWKNPNSIFIPPEVRLLMKFLSSILRWPWRHECFDGRWAIMGQLNDNSSFLFTTFSGGHKN